MAHAISRILYHAYPVSLFAVALLGWGTASLSQVANFNLPPLGGDFTYWNPSLTELSCQQKTTFSIGTNGTCKADGSTNSAIQYTKNLTTNSLKKTD